MDNKMGIIIPEPGVKVVNGPNKTLYLPGKAGEVRNKRFSSF